MTLGSRLRELRLAAGLTQRQTAQRLNMTPAEWSHIEFHRERPDAVLVRFIALALGGEPDELLALLDEWQEAPPLDLSQNICRKVWR